MDSSQEEKIEYAWVALSFLLSVVGALLCFSWYKTKPRAAKLCGIAGCFGFIALIILLYIQ